MSAGALVEAAGQAAAEAAPPVRYRQMRFDLEQVPRYWHSDSPAITHFFHALSLMFPEGEKFFIDSVRHYESQLTDPKLRREVRAFARQEAHHGYQHRLLNDLAGRDGLPTAEIDAHMARIMNWTRKLFGPETQLAATIALEHFTAILAHQLLTNRKLTDGMDPNALALWQWHALEETEHKAVAYDVYQAIGGSYWRRALVMIDVMITFPVDSHFLAAYLLYKDGKLGDWKDVKKALRFAWGKGGFFRTILPELWHFLRRDFHPWQLDNRALLAETEQRLEPYLARR